MTRIYQTKIYDQNCHLLSTLNKINQLSNWAKVIMTKESITTISIQTSLPFPPFATVFCETFTRRIWIWPLPFKYSIDKATLLDGCPAFSSYQTFFSMSTMLIFNAIFPNSKNTRDTKNNQFY